MDEATEIRIWPGKVSIQKYVGNEFKTEELHIDADSIIIEVPQIEGVITLKRLLHEYGFSY